MTHPRNPGLSAFQDQLRELAYGPTEPGHCCSCKAEFSPANTHTPAGWKETKISKLCEDCWDKLFSEEKS